MYLYDTSARTGGIATVSIYVRNDGHCGMVVNNIATAIVKSMYVFSCPRRLCCFDHADGRGNVVVYFVGMCVSWCGGGESMLMVIGEELNKENCYAMFRYFQGCKRRTTDWHIHGMQIINI